MDDKTREKLIDRIRKLLALSTSPNEAEAAAAADKAQALLAEANLSMAEVERVASKPGMIADEEIRTDSKPWRRPLAVAVARLYFCQYLFRYHYEKRESRPSGSARYDFHVFVGEPHNVEVAKLMFTYLLKTIERLAREGSKGLSKGKGRYEQSFKVACVDRLRVRIMERIKAARAGGIKAESGTTLPALADTYDLAHKAATAFMQSQFSTKPSPTRKTMNDIQGALDGRAAGDQIGLDAQVAGAGAHKRLG